MNKNPYEVLSVSQSASDDEIKRAYRDLTRKYHPDANVNNPLADLAEEKFKEVQEAYDTIMKERQQGGGFAGNSGTSGSYYGGAASYGGTSNDPNLQTAFQYIQARQYQSALHLLNQCSTRNAQWYYLSAFANANIGNTILARDHAAQAVNMEPGNFQYRQLLNQLEWNSQRYQNNPYGGGYGYGTSSCGTGNLCCDLWCADTLCECMGGDLCACM
jgi:molecular chaperone DnaJ